MSKKAGKRGRKKKSLAADKTDRAITKFFKPAALIETKLNNPKNLSSVGDDQGMMSEDRNVHDAENVVCDDKWDVEDNLEDILEDTIEDNLASQSRERPRIHIQPVVENPDIRTILFSEDHPGILK